LLINSNFWFEVEKQLKYVLYGDSVHGNSKLKFLFDDINYTLTIEEFWNFLKFNSYTCMNVGTKEYIFIDFRLKVLTNHNYLIHLQPAYITRHWYEGELIDIKTSNTNCLVTKNHSLIENGNKKISPLEATDVLICDGINLIKTPILSKEKVKFSGWVYDISVPTTHNFVINDILVSNTDSLFVHIPSVDNNNIEDSIVQATKTATDINDLITNYLNSSLLPKLHVDTKHNYTQFKNEFTCDSILFLDVKKNYAYSMTSKEGKIFKPSKIEYTGLPIVKVNTSEFSKDLLISLINEIVLNKNIKTSDFSNNLMELAKLKHGKLLKELENNNFKYFGTPVKWSDANYVKEPSQVIGMRLYNTITNTESFKPLSSGLQIPITISSTSKIKKIDLIGEYFINSSHYNVLNYICVPYSYDPEYCGEVFKDYNIKVIDNLWEKLTDGKIIQKVIDLIKIYAKK